MDNKEFNELIELCDEAEAHPDRLTPWELAFMVNLEGKLSEYDLKTFITPKQWDTVNEIQRKLFAT